MYTLRPKEVLPASKLIHQKEPRDIVQDISDINKDIIKLKERLSKCQRSQKKFKVEITKQKDFLKTIEENINILDVYVTNL